MNGGSSFAAPAAEGIRMRTRGLGALVLALLMVMATAAPAFAARGDEGEREKKKKEEDGRVGVVLLTDRLPAVTAGDTVWVALTWEARGVEATGFRVVATKAKGVEVAYPTNTGDHTSLMADDVLSDGELDFTSLRLTVPYGSKKKVEVELEVTYQVDGRTSHEVLVGKKLKRKKKVKLEIPVETFTGADVAQVGTDPQTVAAGSGGWVDVVYTGYAPRVEDIRVVVTDAVGLPIEYPQQGYTSLVHDAVLEDGETDVARVYVDTSGAAPGTYQLAVEATWTKAGETGRLTGVVPVTVAP